MEYPTTVSVSGTETETPSLALGICEFTKVIFRPIKCSNRINWKFVSREFIQCCQEKKASRVEVSFIAESDFVNKGNCCILRDCSDWALDSKISLEFTGLLDDISISLEELKSADSNPNHEILISVLEPQQEETNNS